MEPKYDHQSVEGRIYQMWEDGGFFTPKIDPKKKPFTIILPLPNANDSMHLGHAQFVVEDILARYHIMLGDPTLWLPGADHAGMETQYVFEKKLAKEDKSRFDFDRNTLYAMLWKFSEENRKLNQFQLKRLGFALDWSRYHYSLEPEIVEMVLETFRKLHQDGLIYHGERIVNFCTRCGTAFSELEVDYEEREDKLYFLNYGPIQIATTRPETIFADVAVAVNPKDKRYKALVGKRAVIPLINIEIPIITDPAIEMDFGTGGLKVTPGYDPVDFEIGQKNNLPIINIINRQGRLEKNSRVPDELVGLNIKQAREKTVELLDKAGVLVKTEPLTHSVGVCYRCGTVIEPMVIPQWFVKIKPLAKPAIEAVKKGTTKIFPKKRFEKLYLDWMNNLRDWNISRQVVWGPRIPVWYDLEKNPDIQINFLDPRGEKITGLYKDLKTKYSFGEIKNGLQSLVAPKNASFSLEATPDSLQETDTFDTWFLSGQWPVNTLRSKPGDLEYFYPTSVLDTLWDILPFWVSRMMMLGIYLTGKVPFDIVHLHARVVDKFGKKMSKSKGNVINPIVMVDAYGADALRLALVIGVAPAADVSLSEDKVRGMRNFSNKLWNIGRFLLTTEQKNEPAEKDQELKNNINNLITSTTKNLDNFKFGMASDDLYQFTWHEFADKYIEDYKKSLVSYPTLLESYKTILKLLHPFMPFVTEEIWGLLPNNENHPLIISSWPR